MQPLPRDSTEAELDALDRLCDRLSRFGCHTTPEWLDGWMTALAASRRVVPPAEWIPLAFDGDFERAFDEPAAQREAEAVLMARWRVIAGQLDPEELRIDPDAPVLNPLVLSITDDDRAAMRAGPGFDAATMEPLLYTGAVWAQGFRAAVGQFADDWAPPPAMPADDRSGLASCLRAIDVLTAPHEAVLAYLREYGMPEDVTREDLVHGAVLAAQDLRMLWLDYPPVQTPLRLPARPGRNDPCPCGSGKKFKKCHGADAR